MYWLNLSLDGELDIRRDRKLILRYNDHLVADSTSADDLQAFRQCVQYLGLSGPVDGVNMPTTFQSASADSAEIIRLASHILNQVGQPEGARGFGFEGKNNGVHLDEDGALRWEHVRFAG